MIPEFSWKQPKLTSRRQADKATTAIHQLVEELNSDYHTQIEKLFGKYSASAIEHAIANRLCRVYRQKRHVGGCRCHPG